MTSFPSPTQSTRLSQVGFLVLSLVTGFTLATTGALAIESAEDASLPAAPHQSRAAAPNPIAIPKRVMTAYYIVTSTPSLEVPEEAVDIEHGGIPSNATLHFRIVDSPESAEQFLHELGLLIQDNLPYRVFDMR